MKILLDTNILIAAFIVRGACTALLEHCIRHHKVVTSEFILYEFRKTMLKKMKYSITEVNDAIELLSSKIEIVVPVKLENPICRDPDDDIIIGTAIAGDVDCIITGDKDLLVLKQFNHIDIISPSGFPDYEITNKLRSE